MWLMHLALLTCDIHFEYLGTMGEKKKLVSPLRSLLFAKKGWFHIYKLNLLCIMLENGQTYFKNLVVFTQQDF